MKDLPRDEITALARSIVGDIAPQELMLFRLHSEEFFRDPGRAGAVATHREDAMGFGAGEAVQFVTPMVLMALTEAARLVQEEAVRQIGEQAKAGLREMLRRLFETSGRGGERLSPDQLQRIHAVALAKAGPDPKRAERIADAIVAALSLPPATGPTSAHQ